jgi:hypothetical protein
MLPKKINSKSKINIVHLSSSVERKDVRYFKLAQAEIKKRYVNARLFELDNNKMGGDFLII